VKVAIVGGTGPFGAALAKRLVQAGDDVVIGSRDAGRASEAAAILGCRGAENREAVDGAELVVLSVVAEAALATAEELRAALAAPVLSVASRLEFSGGAARPALDAQSLAEQVAETVTVPVVAGLHSIAARKLGGDAPPDEDAFVCGDDLGGKELALELAGRVVAGRAVDAGPLAVARALEGMTAVIVNVNRRYKAHAGIRITGLS
jgi:8-hydroxy-5-deazaflavin:NADPH oxidoreductase